VGSSGTLVTGKALSDLSGGTNYWKRERVIGGCHEGKGGVRSNHKKKGVMKTRGSTEKIGGTMNLHQTKKGEAFVRIGIGKERRVTKRSQRSR